MGLRLDQRCVVAVLVAHAMALAWLGYVLSPTVDEPAHLVAGLSHWRFGQFDLYRVNPPLIRLIAGLPLLIVAPQTDWSRFTSDPYARPEFALGMAFADANGPRTFWHQTLARWACLPIQTLGAYLCFRWSRELYGVAAGLTSLILWCACPNLLAHGALITPDAGAAALGLTAAYYFWRWLGTGTLRTAALAGLTLGIALLTKSTWIILLALWPLIWWVWRHWPPQRSTIPATEPSAALDLTASKPPRENSPQRPSPAQLGAVLGLGIFILNSGYCFESSGQPLGQFRFISRAFGGQNAHEVPGNRFAETVLANIPVPVPANYLRGIDVQRSDFERGKWSYLGGKLKTSGGWWYYYLYAAMIKTPLGTLALAALLMLARCDRWSTARPGGAKPMPRRMNLGRDEFVLLAPALMLFVFVSSQTGFSRSLRYVLPAWPLILVWLGRGGQFVQGAFLSHTVRSRRLIGAAVLFALQATLMSSAATFPHSLSYFHELVGGPGQGHRYLLDANIDWDQDLLFLKRWYDLHPHARPFHLTRYGFTSPRIAGIHSHPIPRNRTGRPGKAPEPGSDGWFAISVNELFGERSREYAWVQALPLVDRAGYSILIFHETAIRPEPDRQ